MNSQHLSQKVAAFRKTIVARNIRETIAAVVVISVFSFYCVVFKSPLARLGSGIIIVGSLFIIYRLWSSHRQFKPTNQNSALESDLAYVRCQRKLLQTVVWWYLLPLLVGAAVFSAGRNKLNGTTLGIFAAIGIFIYFMNQSAVKRTVQPLETELAEELAGKFNSQSPWD